MHSLFRRAVPTLMLTLLAGCDAAPPIVPKPPKGSAPVATATPTATATASPTPTEQPNRAPQANGDGGTVSENDSVSFLLSGTDADGDSLSFEIVTLPRFGVLTETLPNARYQLSGSWVPNDSFTFRAFDGQAYSDPATVTISITPLPRKLVAGVGRVRPFEGEAGSLNLFTFDLATGTIGEAPEDSVAIAPYAWSMKQIESSDLLTVVEGAGLLEQVRVDRSAGTLRSLGGNLSLSYTTPAPDSMAVIAGKFIYFTDTFLNAVMGYSVDAMTGELTTVPNVPAPVVGYYSVSTVASPDGRFLYAADANYYRSIYAYSVDASTGGLTPFDENPFRSVDAAERLTAHPSGKFLYSLHPAGNTVHRILVDAVSGGVSKPAENSILTGARPADLALSSNGSYAFVGCDDGKEIRTYSIDPATGVMTAMETFSLAGPVRELTVEPTGNYLLAGIDGIGVAVYRIGGDGKLSEVAGSPFAASLAEPRFQGLEVLR